MTRPNPSVSPTDRPSIEATGIDRRRFLGATAAGVALAGAAATGLATTASAAGRPIRSTVTWPRDHELPSFARPRHLDAIDLHTDVGSGVTEMATLLVTLQGVVNRSQPRLYVALQGDGTDIEWLDTIRVPYTTVTDPWHLVAKYIREAAGMVIYDPDFDDSVNIATTIAGIRNGVVVSPTLAAKLAAAPYHVKTLDDLRGRWTDKLTAYRWALVNLWDKCDHRLLTGIGGTSTVTAPGVTWTEVAKVPAPVTDGSNKATYTIDLTPGLGKDKMYVRISDAYTSDGWGPSFDTIKVSFNGTVAADFTVNTDAEQPFIFDLDGSQLSDGGWRFTDGGSYVIYVFDVPSGTTSASMDIHMWNEYKIDVTDTSPTIHVPFPFFRDYIVATKAFVFWLDPLDPDEGALFATIVSKVAPDTPYLGWFVGGHEPQGVTLLSEHGVYVLAADFFTNGSVLGGTRAPIATTQPRATTPPLENKVYLTLTMSEGDNLQYCQHQMRLLWDDAGRGKVPLNWSISPLLADAGPALFSYFQRTATKDDYLVCGPSGAGYTYPGVWPAPMLDAYTDSTGRYLKRTGMDVIYTINRNGDFGDNIEFTETQVASYLKYADIVGFIGNWIDKVTVYTRDGMPIVDQVGFGSIADGQSIVNREVAAWDGNSPLFLALGVLAWNLNPTDVANFVASLDPSYEVLRGDVFLELVKQSGQGA
ncbi:MAG: GxGYxYP domain-containing protein [Mycobacteriales bacterium]